MILDRTDAERLVAAHAPLAAAVGDWGHRLSNRRGDRRDFVQAATLGVWEAARRFDPARGVAFYAYCSPWAKKRVRDLARQESAGGLYAPQDHGFVRRSPVSLAAFCDEDGEAFDFLPAPAAESRRDVAAFWRAVDGCLDSLRLRLVAWLYYRCGWHDAEIAAAMKLSRSRVYQYRADALARLKRAAGRFVEFVA